VTACGTEKDFTLLSLTILMEAARHAAQYVEIWLAPDRAIRLFNVIRGDLTAFYLAEARTAAWNGSGKRLSPI
jgi:hypothetical protein